MGFIKDAKANTLATEAKRAIAEGRYLFTPMLNSPASNPGMSGSVGGWVEMIEAIEAEGWVMQFWSVAQDHKGRPQAYPLFRRRQ